MGGLKFAIVLCVFAGGMSAHAMRTESFGGETTELQTIVSWMAHLNSFYPSEQVTSYEDLSDGSVRNQTLRELRMLENVLHGELDLPQRTLKSITCANVVCGGGDGGKCVTCSAEE